MSQGNQRDELNSSGNNAGLSGTQVTHPFQSLFARVLPHLDDVVLYARDSTDIREQALLLSNVSIALTLAIYPSGLGVSYHFIAGHGRISLSFGWIVYHIMTQPEGRMRQLSLAMAIQMLWTTFVWKRDAAQAVNRLSGAPSSQGGSAPA